MRLERSAVTAPVPEHPSDAHSPPPRLRVAPVPGTRGAPAPGPRSPSAHPRPQRPGRSPARLPGTEPPRCAWGGVRAEGRLPGRSAGSARLARRLDAQPDSSAPAWFRLMESESVRMGLFIGLKKDTCMGV